MTAHPRFTVVVAVRNGVQTLQRCLDSVFEQRTTSVGVIVMDGGSTDGTIAILEQDTDRIGYWETSPDRGICHAWNKAIDHVTGEWVVFLGADDALASGDVLERAGPLLAAVDSDVSIVYGRVDLVDEQGMVIGQLGEPWDEASHDFYSHNTISHQSVFHRRSLFERYGGFDERFRILGDYELMVRVFKYHDPEFIDLTVSRYSVGGLSDRPEALLLGTTEAYRARYVNGLERLPESIAPRVWRARGFELVRRTLGLEAATKMAGVYHRR